MAVDFSNDLKTAARALNRFVRKGQKIPKDALAHYNNLLSATLNADEVENGAADDYPSGSLTSSFPGVSAINSVVLAASSSREYILIQNIGAETVYINFDAASTVGGGLQLLPGASYTSQIPQFVITEINAITDTGTSTLAIYSIG